VVSVVGRGGGVWVVVAVVLVLAGVFAAVLGARAVAHSDAQRGRLASHLASTEIASTLRLAIQHEEDLVVSASAFISGDPHASAAGFDRWAGSVHAMRRYPELENIGLVVLVAASRLRAFEAWMATHPMRALGELSPAPAGRLRVLPAGKRPHYCIAVAGLARNAASYLPAGLDYCAFAPALFATRDSGQALYGPFSDGASTTLGIETPVYRGGSTPATVAGRRSAFVGWLGERLEPQVILARALEGHPHVAVLFRYDSAGTHVSFASGSAPRDAQSTTISLHNGWTLESFGGETASGVLADRDAFALLAGGILLSALLGLLVLVLGTGRRRARSLVREQTRELSQKNRELSHMALHDPLTGLPNRALVLDRAERMLARGAREESILAGAMFVDIDGFKHVNDRLGHAAGDELLRVVGGRLQSAVRDQDTVGRLGGDEFVVLVECSTEEATLERLADRMTASLREPVDLDGVRDACSVTASIGVAIGRYDTAEGLLRDADLALYSAKAAGKDRHTLFDPSMQAGMRARLGFEAELSTALEQRQFFLLYQPILDLSTHEVVGVEALIRWRHPTRGVMAPHSFIGLAEESGMIAPIGRWILEEACRQAATWAAQGLEIAVNVSAHQLSHRGFAEEVRRALQTSGIAPSSLTVEITETALMRDVPGAYERMREIKSLGVRLALDDFGTGYASLSHLQRMPVDILKIDRGFVAALNDGGRSRDLLEAILGVAESLSLKVIAEGVEDEAQLTVLEQLGCQMAQGYLLGQPVPPQSIETLLASRQLSANGPRHPAQVS